MVLQRTLQSDTLVQLEEVLPYRSSNTWPLLLSLWSVRVLPDSENYHRMFCVLQIWASYRLTTAANVCVIDKIWSVTESEGRIQLYECKLMLDSQHAPWTNDPLNLQYLDRNIHWNIPDNMPGHSWISRFSTGWILFTAKSLYWHWTSFSSTFGIWFLKIFNKRWHVKKICIISSNRNGCSLSHSFSCHWILTGTFWFNLSFIEICEGIK